MLEAALLGLVVPADLTEGDWVLSFRWGAPNTCRLCPSSVCTDLRTAVLVCATGARFNWRTDAERVRVGCVADCEQTPQVWTQCSNVRVTA